MVEKTQHARGSGSRHPALGSTSDEHPAAPLSEEFVTRIAVSSAMKVSISVRPNPAERVEELVR